MRPFEGVKYSTAHTCSRDRSRPIARSARCGRDQDRRSERARPAARIAPTCRSNKRAWARASSRRCSNKRFARAQPEDRRRARSAQAPRQRLGRRVRGKTTGRARSRRWDWGTRTSRESDQARLRIDDAFGQDGPRWRAQRLRHGDTGHSGITAATGTETSGPIKTGAPIVDYATGTTGALRDRGGPLPIDAYGEGPVHRHGEFERGLMLQPAQITDNLHRARAKRQGNKMRFAAQCCTRTRTASYSSRVEQPAHRRLYTALGDIRGGRLEQLRDRAKRFTRSTRD